MGEMRGSQSNRLLGYPDDARLLIINADDFGLCHAINEGIFRSIREGVVCSTSLMMPCPWALHAAELLKQNPDIPFGVHLTVISDMPYYRYRPMACNVPSLVDETGYFYKDEAIPTFVERAKLDEVEIEFRAQIEAALAANLKPTHLDWHCLRNGGRPDIFDLTVRLAKEYGLAVRAYDHPYIDQLHRERLPAVEHSLLDSYSMELRGKAARYAQLLRELPVGLNEWAVHPGLGNDELQAVEPGSWQVRQSDFEFVMSAEAREIIEQEGIVLLSYAPIQGAWQQQRL